MDLNTIVRNQRPFKKVTLLTKEGKETVFNFPVDAKEALEKIDPETGEHLYFLPKEIKKVLVKDEGEDSLRKVPQPVGGVRRIRERKMKKDVEETEGEQAENNDE